MAAPRSTFPVRAPGAGVRPPPLPPSRARRALVPAGLGAMVALAAIFLATRIHSGMIPYPECGFKALTGLPCPGCGGVRSLAALGAGELVRAVQLNPLVAGAAMVLLLALPVTLVDAAWNRGRLAAASARAVGRPDLGWYMLGAVAATWVHLFLAGR